MSSDTLAIHSENGNSIDWIIDELFEKEDPRELKIIFKYKSEYLLGEFDAIENIWDPLCLEGLADPIQILNHVAQSSFDQYISELADFKKKYGEDIKDTLIKAKGGDDKSLFRLISWDKSWICMDFVCSKIVKAQATGNKDFLNELADQLKKKSPTVIKKTARQNETIILLMKLFTFAASARDKKISHTELKAIHAMLESKELLGNENDVSRFSDFTYFKKFLTRHKVPIE